MLGNKSVTFYTSEDSNTHGLISSYILWQSWQFMNRTSEPWGGSNMHVDPAVILSLHAPIYHNIRC